MPEPEFASDQDKINLAEFMTKCIWRGMKVELTCQQDGEFSAIVLMSADLGAPAVMPRVLRSLVVLANQEADALDAQERGMRPAVDPERANIFVVPPEEASPLEDTLFRIGLHPVWVRDPSCVIFFSADWQVTGWTLRTFARLAAEQASLIEAAYPEDAPVSRAQAPAGARRPARVAGEQPRQLYQAREASPPPSLGIDYEPEFNPATADDVSDILEPVGMAEEPTLPPPEIRQRMPSTRARGPAMRKGPLSMGVPGAGGEPAKIPDPVQPRIHSKRQQG
jgi:hypothetical protein